MDPLLKISSSKDLIQLLLSFGVIFGLYRWRAFLLNDNDGILAWE